VICPDCKEPYEPPAAKTSGPQQQGQLYHGTGCEKCLQTGYLGRTGIFELLLVDDDIRPMIVGQEEAHRIKQTAVQKGMLTLRQDGLRKAAAGTTTIEEVYRVTQDSLQSSEEVS
jgi:general secretion pathway protein E